MSISPQARLAPGTPFELASPAQSFPATPFPGAPILAQPPPLVSQQPPYAMPPVPRRGSRLGTYAAVALFLVLAGAGGYWLWPRAGLLQLSVKPPDARVTVGGEPFAGGPPFRLAARAGVHRLAVSRPGYVPFESNIQISAGQKGHLDIVLRPSPDTGFALTGAPPVSMVLLDGRPPVLEKRGGPANNRLHATRIAPGPHVIEIKGNPLFRPWRKHFVQEPGRIVLLHADLVPNPATRAQPGFAGTPPRSRSTVGPSRPAPVAKVSNTSGRKRSLTRRSSATAERLSPGKDLFEETSRSRSQGKDQPLPAEDIFESYGRPSAVAGNCVATIASKPWAEVLIDGRPTGKLTPLVNYPLPCGTHRLTFKNEDLMIERNETVTLRPGRPFKKIFSLVADVL
ncbi:MAG: PEGA domain-containing protein [Deltaproteobacteria bacterium]|nr:PEGA domain-containing protein [Deltaproteobacteria bacterium]